LADQNVEAMEGVAKGFLGAAQRSRTTLSSCVVQCNVTNPEQVSSLIQQADEFAASTERPEAESSATLLVNCAGITRDNWISQMSIDEWTSVMDVNLTGTYLTCRAFLDQERVDADGKFVDRQASIVNVGSIVSELGNLGQVNYAASKGGVLGLTRSLAKEVAGRGVRVNAVVPGFIDTPMAEAVPDHVKERILSKIPLRRFGQPEEVANLVNFLLSPRSGYITGESIAVSGMISL
jgi:NAD(P)-dependent dehydrogenase (short-subunit alcohol dehydrogenase family)